MQKNRFMILLALLAISVSSIGLLAWSTQRLSGGGFSRKILETPLYVTEISTVSRTSYIVGFDSDSIYIADRNVSNCYEAFSIKAKSQKTRHQLFTSERIVGPVNLSIERDRKCLSTLATYKLFLGRAGNDLGSPLQGIGNFFADVCPAGKNSVAIRTLSSDKKNYTLGCWNDSKLELKQNILTNQGDGFFSTDGMLLCTGDQVIYVYYYRNEFIVMDTSLTISYRSRTIDTISRARINVARPSGKGVYILASPARIVNDKCAVSNRLLFVNSKVISDDESISDFRNNSAVDIYDLSTGRYVSSFYIPRFNGAEVKEFKINGNSLVCRYPDTIVLFHLSFLTDLRHRAL